MSREKRIEEQIQHFYENVPNVDDALPLKDYLLKHEDSRMAWYLLGKQYERSNDDAKATYCFGQAGEIYTAFEGKPAPELPKPTVKPRRKLRIGLLWFGVITGLLVAVGLVIYTLHHEGQKLANDAPNDSQSRIPASSVNTSISSQVVELTSSPRVIAAVGNTRAQAFAELGNMLQHSESTAPQLMVIGASLGKWNDWLKSGKPIAAVYTEQSAGVSAIRWYDPRWCDCMPQDASEAQQAVREWKPLQEAKAVLQSAFLHYREQTGSWPTEPVDLNDSYPMNTIAGWNDEMTAWFDEMSTTISEQIKAEPDPTTLWPLDSGSVDGLAAPAGMFGEMMEQPLEVIVDKGNHRLAVVSGTIILRNYEVGLGGNRTPKGEFVITEKVREPNGSTTSEYGSRGMTLSNGRYGIHGTNQPNSLGKDESLGCVRMSQEDLEELFDLVSLGTKVTIVEEGLPTELRVPQERFKLSNTKNETNPHKVYNWLN
ncbi:MAG: L,D-transpeptidase [Candidatus Cohnella colombiensis]|uniref:L,D-transpeptidase n=1 Tax=Candidatus Cohnella colombiensis TaxID=3121368 RepID=A0AA95JDW9_9BACL|nr:MAG: L,D-transpeptidase [Cohnella sp.]